MDWAYAFSDDASFEPVFGADAVFDAEEPGFCEPGREHDDSDIIPLATAKISRELNMVLVHCMVYIPQSSSIESTLIYVFQIGYVTTNS